MRPLREPSPSWPGDPGRRARSRAPGRAARRRARDPFARRLDPRGSHVV